MTVIRNITKSLGFKAILLGIMILLMLIPVVLVREVVKERARRAEQVEREILDAWGGELKFAGPVLRIPCRETRENITRDGEGKVTRETIARDYSLWVTPANLEIRTDLTTREKSRGIFSVPVYSGDLLFTGRFDPSEALAGLTKEQEAFTGQAEVVLVLSSQKGIRSLESARWGEDPLDFKPGDQGFGLLAGGIHAPAPFSGGESRDFRIGLAVQGGRQIRILPLGEQTRVGVNSDWPAPSFQGEYLPDSRELDEAGFQALWNISYLSRGIPLFWSDGGRDASDPEEALRRAFFGVDFLKVLDHYALNERAVKYTILFIIVPFLTLFLMEIFWKREIHPVQYLLAGIGNVVFYLLLLSISEHIPFNLAYLVSALAVTLMMCLYSRSLLAGWRESWFMAPVMGLSYLYLFITLQSEDWALLIGSVGAFTITGLVMFVTRKVNWYGDSI